MFWLGTDLPLWLGRTPHRLILTRRVMVRRSYPRALGPWFLDSGAFTELADHGRWAMTPTQWVGLARRCAEHVGQLAHVSTQDWLCVPRVLDATGGTVADHQARTLESWHTLTQLAPELPWVPTLQGWHPDDYLAHAEMYEAEDTRLADLPLVGVGSIATRQHSRVVGELVVALHDLGLRNLHAFGAKRMGLASWGWAVASADSQGWSLDARWSDGPRCRPDATHQRCTRCLPWALEWAAPTAALVGAPGYWQPSLQLEAHCTP